MALLTASCTTAPMQRALITPDAIRNPSVGFKGYALPLPAGYTAVAATNMPANLDPSVKDLALKWHRVFDPGSRTNHWIRFEESMVIYGPRNAFVFGVVAARNHGAFNLACATDLKAEQFLGQTLNTLFLRETIIEKREVVIRNRKRIAHFRGLDAKPSNGYDTSDCYLVLGSLDELYCLLGRAKEEDRQELYRVAGSLADGLDFAH